MADYPLISQGLNRLCVTIAPYGEGAKRVESEFVLDLDRDNNVIGIEIINLKLLAGCKCLDVISRMLPTTGSNLRYSYDADVDAFYLTVRDERSMGQEAQIGEIVLNENGEIVEFGV